jgi:hypothetical protein
MANRVQLSGPKEAEKYVLHMVSKSINVTKNRRGNQEWTVMINILQMKILSFQSLQHQLCKFNNILN